MHQWTLHQDTQLLRFYAESIPNRRWKTISQQLAKIGITKTDIECRQRFVNYLDPKLSKQKWNLGQIQILFKNYDKFGSKWKRIQHYLPMRSQRQIKNMFYSFLRSILLKCSKILKFHYKRNCLQLSSSVLKQLYEGTDKFDGFSGHLSAFLKTINYFNEIAVIYQAVKKEKSFFFKVFSLMKEKKVGHEEQTIAKKTIDFNFQQDKKVQKEQIKSSKKFNENQDSEKVNFENQFNENRFENEKKQVIKQILFYNIIPGEPPLKTEAECQSYGLNVYQQFAFPFQEPVFTMLTPLYNNGHASGWEQYFLIQDSPLQLSKLGRELPFW